MLKTTVLEEEAYTHPDKLWIVQPAKVISIHPAVSPDEMFMNLYCLNYESVKRFALTLHKSKQDAEDTTQQIFMVLWEKRDKIHLILKPENYLMTMVKNQFINTRRKERNNQVSLQNYISSYETIANLTEQDVLLRETTRILNQRISILPPRMRRVFILRYHGYKFIEISKRMGIATQTVKNHLQTAANKMDACV